MIRESPKTCGVGSSEFLKRARNASKRNKSRVEDTTSLNNSLNESIKSFERIYKDATQQDIYGKKERNSEYVFEENEVSPEKGLFQHRRLSSFGRLKQNLEIDTSAKAAKIKNEISTNTSIYLERKFSSSGGGTPKQMPLSSKRQSLKATINSIANSKYVGIKSVQPHTTGSLKSKVSLLAYREPQSVALKPKPSKNQASRVAEGKRAQLAAKYGQLNDKLADIIQMVDNLTFETHFALPEMIGDSDRFRANMNETIKKMQKMVETREKIVSTCCENSGKFLTDAKL